MENLLKLCLFLLCLETALSVQCALCRTYKNGECLNGNGTCTTRPGETCMIRRILYASESHNLKSAELRCTDVCKFEVIFYEGLITHTYCCNSEDFCNDINLPIIMD
ncbi:acrosomal protein SP-10-like [Mesocricetus auratus]|uniref:Acrosomal protein SP-10-like n=1 Tax=Mesocricetus auratus TaxID=10036 RepID=A0ABM2W5K7_MESAU|nr:acrosomal protein SP-10-like [Mesocricetus auratus]